MDVTFTNVLEGARQYFQGLPAATGSTASPIYPNTSDQQQQQHNRSNVPDQNHDKSHAGVSSYWPPQQTRERTQPEENQRPSPHTNVHQNSVNYDQIGYTDEQQYFQFPRPNSREAPSNISQQQYQSHILPNPSYNQPQSPQQPRIPSRHQDLNTPPSSQIYHQLQPPSSQSHSIHPSQMYHNINQSRSYYPQHKTQHFATPTVNHSYKIPATQTYTTPQENLYYQKIYSTHSQNSLQNASLYSTSKSVQDNAVSVEQSQPTSQQHKTTHNLPPIAALSSINYHSNRASRDTSKLTNSRSRLPTSTVATTSMAQTNLPAQQTSRIPLQYSAAEYNNALYQQNKVTTQNYMAMSSSTATYSSTPVQMQSSAHQYYQQTNKVQEQLIPQQPNSSHSSATIQNTVNRPTMPVVKQKRESPLDLSVKTVRTPADSTLDDADETQRASKYYQQAGRLPAQSYPSYDVYQNSFQRNLTQRSSHAQTASAPKVDFNPNFSMPSNPTLPNNYRVDSRPTSAQQVYNNAQLQRAPYQQTRTVPATAHVNSYVTTQSVKKSDSLPRIEFPTPGHVHKTAVMYPVPPQDMQRKRTADTAPSLIPNKVPKVDSWRQTIDQQIEQRFSTYQSRLQQEHKQPVTKPIINGNYMPQNQERTKDSTTYQKSYHSIQTHPSFNNYYSAGGHSQTYIPSPVPHHYPGYSYGSQSQQQSQTLGSQPLSRSNSNSSLPTGRNSSNGGADKRVLNLLRNSLEIRGAKEAQKKLEQEAHQQHVQQPSTDVTAPLQPKPGIMGRHNVSPFTAASLLERNSNTPPTYKFHIPRAIDSVRFDATDGAKGANLPNQKNAGDTNMSIIQNNSNNTDLDGLAAFLAARIRTKAELKQVGPTQNMCNNNANNLQIPETAPKTLTDISPQSQISTNGSSSGSSPPKLSRERLPFPPRRRLFSRNEDDGVSGTTMVVPPRDKSGLRSSSETSVFDFPDSDSDGEMPVLERQSLEDMRRDRKSVLPKPNASVEVDAIPFDDIFGSMCNDLADQLRQGNGKKRGRRKKVVEPEMLAMLQTVTKQKPLQAEIKIEKHDDSDSDVPLIKCKTNVENKAAVSDEDFNATKPLRRKVTSSSEDSDSEVEGNRRVEKNDSKILSKSLETAVLKKPSFGDGTGFHPGWEEELYKYKRSIRMPARLIHVTRPPNSQRSTSLPDLDPYPNSPAPSSIAETEYTSKSRSKQHETLDTDAEDSNSSFNFSFNRNYDSEGSSSVKSLNLKDNNSSILDKLLERYGGRKRKKTKKKDDTKVIPKCENTIELLPTPTDEKKPDAMLLGFRKKTVENFKDVFVDNTKSRIRTENRVLKQRASIKEVFGEDRPASAPPTVDGELKGVVKIKREEKDDGNESSQNQDTKQVLKNKLLNRGRKCSNLLKVLVEKKIKSEYSDALDEIIDIKRDPESKSETPSLDGDDSNMSVKKKMKFKYMRRKFSSGFDYIRKKKKQVKKENAENETNMKVKRRGFVSKTNPESVQDIQREIKTWVLNKGIGETHLHRAARLGYTDITAFCLEKMGSTPSPKDNAGYTPLHEACSRGHLDIARLLLMYGANVSESAQGGIRPLHEAAENGYVEIVRLLLSYGADPVLATYSGLTPLSLAADEPTATLLQHHLADIRGESGPLWSFHGPASCFDPEDSGYDPLEDTPEPDPPVEEEDMEFEMSDAPLPNLYTLRGEAQADRWMLLQDLSNMLKIKSRDALLKQISPLSPTTSSTSPQNHKNVLRELKMSDFLEQARCCQFLNGSEKINTRASKIALVKYTDKVKQLLNVEKVLVTMR